MYLHMTQRNMTTEQFPARVTMLDAHELDAEVFNLLKSQVKRIHQILPPWVITRHECTMDLILHFIIWKLSVEKFHSTFGQQLLNIKYSDKEFNSKKSYILCAEKLLTYYLVHGSNTTTASLKNLKSAESTLKYFEVCLRTASVLNLLWFFRQGRYPTLIDRLLGLRPVYITRKHRTVGYRLMTRELIWHGFIELISFTLTLINYQYLKRKLWRIFLWSKKPVAQPRQPLSYTSSTKCAICTETPVLPQYMGCTHVFCYYCIQSNRLIDSKYECPSCSYYQENISFVQC